MTTLHFALPKVFMVRLACIITIYCLLTRVTSDASAQGYDYLRIFSKDYSSTLSVEVDPLAFIFKGHSLHLRYQPMFSERFLIGIGTYAMDVPAVLVDLYRDNRDRGWDARIRGAYSLYGELYAKEGNQGWFIGEQIGLQRFRLINHQEARGSTTFNTLLAMTYAGYAWHPYEGALYLKPWLGLGFTGKIDGINRVGASVYHIGPWLPMMTVHAGIRFEVYGFRTARCSGMNLRPACSNL